MLYVEGGLDGKKILKMPKEERELLAERFSEGSKELKSLLLNLWNHNIETLSCCIGKYEDNGDGEYDCYCCFSSHIAIRYNKNSKDYLNSVFNYIKDAGIKAKLGILTKDGDDAFEISSHKMNDYGLFENLNQLIGKKTKKKKEFVLIELLLHELKNNVNFLRYDYEKTTNSCDDTSLVSEGKWHIYGNIYSVSAFAYILSSFLESGMINLKQSVSNLRVNYMVIRNNLESIKCNLLVRKKIQNQKKVLKKKNKKNII